MAFNLSLNRISDRSICQPHHKILQLYIAVVYQMLGEGNGQVADAIARNNHTELVELMWY